MFFFLLLCVLHVALPACIHDRLIAQRRQWSTPSHAPSTAEPFRLPAHDKRSVLEDEPDVHEFKPLRIEVDYRFTAAREADSGGGEPVPLWDVDRLCVRKGQWVKMGQPDVYGSAHDAAQKLPRCAPACDQWPANSTNRNKAGCNCYFRCSSDDVLWRERRALLYEMMNATVGFFSSVLSARRLVNGIGLNANMTACGCGNDALSTRAAPANTGMPPLAYDYARRTDVDLVLFVTARSTRFLSDDVIAFACACDDDYYHRPTFAVLNFGSNRLDFVDNDTRLQLHGVALHEATHALGFSADKFHEYLALNKNGSSSGNNSSHVDGDDIRYNASRRHVEDAWLRAERDVYRVRRPQVSVERGGSLDLITAPAAVTRIVLSDVVDAARVFYACAAMDGVELENDDVRRASQFTQLPSSHWEQRVLYGEYMTTRTVYEPRVSNVTLALLHATGYYRVNFTRAAERTQHYTFGQNEGCDFVAPTCDERRASSTCELAQAGAWMCGVDERHTLGRCSVRNHGAALDAFYAYFPTSPTWGGDNMADFCPMVTYNLSMHADCRVRAHQAAALFERGGTFSAASRCIDSSLVAAAATRDDGTLLSDANAVFLGGCYALRCTRLGRLRVRVGRAWQTCERPLQVLSVSGYRGALTCPGAVETATLCDQVPRDDFDAIEPTLSGVEPRGTSGGASLDDVTLRVELTGTQLETAAAVRIGHYVCLDIDAATRSSTRVACTGFIDELDGADQALRSTVAEAERDASSGRWRVTVELRDGSVGVLDAAFDAPIEATSHGGALKKLNIFLFCISLLRLLP